MQLGEFLDAYKPNEKHRILMTNVNEFNFILPDDGKIYFISGMDFTTGSYLYDVTKLKEQLATVGKTLEDVGIWGNSNGKFYYSDTSNDLSIENIERINNIEKEQQLSEYIEWLRDYYYDRLEELNESMS